MSLLLVVPIALPLLGAGLCLAFWGNRPAHRAITSLATLGLLASSIAILVKVSEDGIQVTEIGGWAAPAGIVVVADLFSAIMLCLNGIIGTAVVLYSLQSIGPERSSAGYYPLVLVLLGGVSGAFITGDFFNLYVWFEVMLMASFVLLALGGGTFQIEGALKYVTINILSSVVFLTTLGLLYSVSGTLNFADLSRELQASPETGITTTLAMLFMVSFGIKAALFPVFFWLPSSYHTPPVAVSALFAGLLTEVGVYALIRIFTLLFVHDVSFTHTVILVVSGLSMITGVLGAVAQSEFRRILSFHIISQIGYMTMGLGLFTSLGLTGAIYYIVHNVLVETNLFLVSGLVHRLRGSYELRLLGGLSSNALVSMIFLTSALSVAGVPPFPGFFAKLTLARAGFETDEYLIVGVALTVGFLTLLVMSRIWNEVFAKAPAVEPEPGGRLGPLQVVSTAALAVLMICVGLGAGPMLDLCARASDQLLNPSEYVTAVLGE